MNALPIHVVFGKHKIRPNLTNHWQVERVGMSFIYTPLGLNPKPFVVLRSLKKGYTSEPSPLGLPLDFHSLVVSEK